MVFLRRRYSGFTLIELLVVIAIIGVLSTLAIIALGSARLKARDSKRVADLSQIGKALELYYSDNNYYPTLITPGQPIAIGSTVYLAQVPSNPTPRTDGNCPNANYIYNGGSQAYSLTSCLGSQSGSISAGIFFATPQGSASCGVPIVDRDGYAYNTVQIGSQCWMAKSLATRTKPDGSVLPAGGSGTLRDCSGAGNVRGTEADCDAGYTVYTWAGAMNGSTTEGAQGMCPDGWHIPTDAEQDTLDQYLVTVGNSCSPSRSTYSCSGAGTKMMPGGSSGFNGTLAGQRSSGGSFSYYGQLFAYWSSTISSTAAFDRGVWTGNSGGATVYRGADNQTFALSVRCLKNQ